MCLVEQLVILRSSVISRLYVSALAVLVKLPRAPRRSSNFGWLMLDLRLARNASAIYLAKCVFVHLQRRSRVVVSAVAEGWFACLPSTVFQDFRISVYFKSCHWRSVLLYVLGKMN